MSESRTYNSPLREAQAEATRQLILDTLSETVAEQGLLDFSVRELAKRAGMSERTVYRHFPDRDALFDALIDKTSQELDWDGAEDRMGLRSYDDIAHGVEQSFRGFEAEEIPTRVAIQLQHGLRQPSGDVRRRNDRHRRILAEALPEVDDEARARLFALLRVIMSSRTWLRLKEEFGLDGDESGPLVGWAVQLMVDEVKRTGHVPGGATAPDQTS